MSESLAYIQPRLQSVEKSSRCIHEIIGMMECVAPLGMPDEQAGELVSPTLEVYE